MFVSVFMKLFIYLIEKKKKAYIKIDKIQITFIRLIKFNPCFNNST